MSFIKGFIFGLYVVVMFKYLGVNNYVYLAMLTGLPFITLSLFWNNIK